jgi:hypothetical protein
VRLSLYIYTSECAEIHRGNSSQENTNKINIPTLKQYMKTCTKSEGRGADFVTASVRNSSLFTSGRSLMSDCISAEYSNFFCKIAYNFPTLTETSCGGIANWLFTRKFSDTALK